jgi:predicted outer membrane protein
MHRRPRSPSPRAAIALLCTTLLAGSALASGGARELPAAPGSHEASEPWHGAGRGIDETAEVLAILHGMDVAQIEAARVAQERAGDAVRALARRLAAEHSLLEERVRALAAKAGAGLAAETALGPAPAVPRRLRDVRGAVFDLAYLQMVAAENLRLVGELEEELREPGQDDRARRLMARAIAEARARAAEARELSRILYRPASAMAEAP